MSEPAEFHWKRDHERYHLLSQRTAVEQKWAVPAERAMDSNPRLLHEALAAAFILRKHRSLESHFDELADAHGTPNLEKIRELLAEHAGQIRSRLAALKSGRNRRSALLSPVPSDYVEKRTDHDAEMFRTLLKSEAFKQAVLQAAGIRSRRLSRPKRTKSESWNQAKSKPPRRRGRPPKRA